MRTALFGGSFNPPHLSHVMSVSVMLSCLDVDELLVTPANTHAFGKSLVSYEHRAAMTRIAMAPFGERVVVSDVERTLGGESRTIRVVEHLLAEAPGRHIVLVVGTDILDELHLWLESDRLLSLTELAVLQRQGYERAHPALFGPPIPRVSSSDVRAMLADGDLDGARLQVPRAVLRYIREHGLYLGTQSDEEGAG